MLKSRKPFIFWLFNAHHEVLMHKGVHCDISFVPMNLDLKIKGNATLAYEIVFIVRRDSRKVLVQQSALSFYDHSIARSP